MTLRFETHHAPTLDARRGGLVLIAPGGELWERTLALADMFATQGYETLALGAASQVARTPLDAMVAGLAPPVVLLGFGEGAAMAWTMICSPDTGVAAASLYDPPLARLTGRPLRPAILHFGGVGGAISPQALEVLRDRYPDMPVYPYDAPVGADAPQGDAVRLAHLRTLQLFHRASGAKGEMGGG